MGRTVKLVVGLIATAVLAAGVTTGVAAAEPATVDVTPGTYLIFDNHRDAQGKKTPGETCTLGVVGTDSAGRKVGITAGHCNPGPIKPGEENKPFNLPQFQGVPEALHGQNIAGNEYEVWSRDQVERADAPPIGWIRFVAPGSESTTTKTDYMVIEFAPHVVLWSTTLDKDGKTVRSTNGRDLFKVNSIHRDSSGAVALPETGESIENFGASSDRNGGTIRLDDIFALTKAPNNGTVTEVKDGMIRSTAQFIIGDSGGPVVMRGTGEWVGIVSGSDLNFALGQWVNTSAKNILDNLNPRNVTGSGFTPVDNESTAPTADPACASSLC
ncbi:hypothetical protein ACWFRB_02355 [Rhodococcus sp. NPDC055112]